jgi:FAD/FMN-containing dehydrogenase
MVLSTDLAPPTLAMAVTRRREAKVEPMSEVETRHIEQLQSEIVGDVCLPGSAGFDEATNIWNGSIAKRPAVVARCSSAQDVAVALRVALEAGLEVSVRGGGHSYAGSALCDGGLTIDLSKMNQVAIDPDAQRAVCGGGATWADLDSASQEHRLAVPGGFISHTGIGGLTLGGGLGWLSRKAGLSCDNLVGAEIVTADGSVLHLSDTENPDLFWAIRGGGGNFGVVTSFEYQLTRVGPLVHLGMFFYAPDDAGEMLRFARTYFEGLPDDSGAVIVALNAPPMPFVPPEHHFAPVYALGILGLTDPESHAELVKPIRGAPVAPLFELMTPMPYVALQQMFNQSAPWGILAYEKALYLDELTDGAIDVIVEHFPKKTSPMSNMPIFVLGGAFARVPEDAVAFGGRRTTKYLVNIDAASPDPSVLETETTWVRDFWSALVPHAQGTGGYVNFMSEADEDRVKTSYGAAKYARLAEIKAKVDPDNVFHINANIKPTA